MKDERRALSKSRASLLIAMSVIALLACAVALGAMANQQRFRNFRPKGFTPSERGGMQFQGNPRAVSWNQSGNRPGSFPGPQGVRERQSYGDRPRSPRAGWIPNRGMSQPSRAMKSFGNPRVNQQPTAPKGLLKLLDQDGDGFIDSSEISSAAKVVRQLDYNNDGRIGPAESRLFLRRERVGSAERHNIPPSMKPNGAEEQSRPRPSGKKEDRPVGRPEFDRAPKSSESE
jgi:hypothetical protein